MRSRYQPDGSVDDEADRMLEILRRADEELARQQRDQAQQMTMHVAPATVKNVALPSELSDMPTIMDFIQDPMADLTQVLMPPNPYHPNTKP